MLILCGVCILPSNAVIMRKGFRRATDGTILITSTFQSNTSRKELPGRQANDVEEVFKTVELNICSRFGLVGIGSGLGLV